MVRRVFTGVTWVIGPVLDVLSAAGWVLVWSVGLAVLTGLAVGAVLLFPWSLFGFAAFVLLTSTGNLLYDKWRFNRYRRQNQLTTSVLQPGRRRR